MIFPTRFLFSTMTSWSSWLAGLAPPCQLPHRVWVSHSQPIALITFQSISRAESGKKFWNPPMSLRSIFPCSNRKKKHMAVRPTMRFLTCIYLLDYLNILDILSFLSSNMEAGTFLAMLWNFQFATLYTICRLFLWLLSRNHSMWFASVKASKMLEVAGSLWLISLVQIPCIFSTDLLKNET